MSSLVLDHNLYMRHQLDQLVVHPNPGHGSHKLTNRRRLKPTRSLNERPEVRVSAARERDESSLDRSVVRLRGEVVLTVGSKRGVELRVDVDIKVAFRRRRGGGGGGDVGERKLVGVKEGGKHDGEQDGHGDGDDELEEVCSAMNSLVSGYPMPEQRRKKTCNVHCLSRFRGSTSPDDIELGSPSLLLKPSSSSA